MSDVLGVIQVRDEFPLVALSATYALEFVVDALAVIDDGSSDRTPEFLRALGSAYPGRVMLMSRGESGFTQARTLREVVRASGVRRGTMIVPIDADEFVLGPDRTLSPREVLRRTPPHEIALRVPVRNWIVPSDFSEHRLSDFTRIHAMATPRFAGAVNLFSVAHEIRAGLVNYFDVPFSSKVFFRHGHGLQASTGSHRVSRWPLPTRTLPPSSHGLSIAHLPLTSIERASHRVDQSLRLLRADKTPYVGWQSHLIASIFEANKEEDFWRRHSLSEEMSPSLYSESSVLSDHLQRVLEIKGEFLNMFLD